MSERAVGVPQLDLAVESPGGDERLSALGGRQQGQAGHGVGVARARGVSRRGALEHAQAAPGPYVPHANGVVRRA